TPVASRWPVPSVVEPIVNTTVPVGAPEAGAFGTTWAVTVTCWPLTAASGSMLTLVRVSAADTVTVAGDVAADAAKSVVPTYLALTCVWPSGRAVVAIVADPDAST